MADSLSSAKKILPCLLDRLTDGAETIVREAEGRIAVTVGNAPGGADPTRVFSDRRKDVAVATGDAAGSTAQPKSLEVPGISPAAYHQGFRRDLAMLLNTKSHQAAEGLADFPEAECSVINYGMRDPAGRPALRQDILDIERQIREAILRFEPRLAPATLRVRALPAEEISRTAPNTVGFEITGTLWSSPLPEYFHVKTEINLENGRCSF